MLMQKILFMMALSLIAHNLWGQEEKTTYKTVSNQFETFYNQGKYDSLFVMFSPEMQVALPLDKAVEFFTGLKNQAGQITSRQFIKYESTYAVYKTHFERGLYGVNISIENHSKINGLFFKPYTDEVLPMIERNRSTMILPFKEEWHVVWGGDTKALNYHIDNKAQKNAFDFIILDENGKSFRTDGQKNEDYYAFGKEIIAPCDGEIVLMVDGIKENKPGEFNAIYIPGNSIILKTEQNEFLFFAHFKQHSIKVKQGDKVIRGQVLGLCGNTGNSSEPHLHFHIQNVENMNVATGAKCYFEKIIANGEIKTDYSPVKNDKIKNY